MLRRDKVSGKITSEDVGKTKEAGRVHDGGVLKVCEAAAYPAAATRRKTGRDLEALHAALPRGPWAQADHCLPSVTSAVRRPRERTTLPSRLRTRTLLYC